jgi:peroxiredoxin
MSPLLAALLISAAPANTVRFHESGAARVGSAAPGFGGWDLAGARVLTLEGLRRTPFLAPLLLTFGASGCKPCAEGLPRLKALSVKHPELRLVFVDVESDADKAQAFVARLRLEGPALLDKLEVIATAYGVGGEEKAQLPRTFLIDAGGKVRAIYIIEGDDLERAIEADLRAASTPAGSDLEAR